MSTPVESLPPHDRLLWLIGRVCQTDVQLESALLDLWIQLTGPGPAMWLAPTNGERLISDCVVMLPRADLSEAMSAAGLEALDAARRARSERNRVVHDMWLPDAIGTRDADPEQYSRRQQLRQLEVRVTPQTLDDVAAVAVALTRSSYRVSAVWLSARGSPLPSAAAQLSTARDRFDLTPEGAAIAHDD